MTDDFYRAVRLDFVEGGIEIGLSTGVSFTIPFTSKLKAASKRERRHWEFVSNGSGIYWPDVDEFVSVDELYRDRTHAKALMRDCRFCGERSRWNSNTCDSCGKERWNDPDDTKLGRTLGKEERENYEVALARVRFDRAQQKLIDDAQRQPDAEEEKKTRH